VTDLAPDLPRVKVDPGQIEQVLDESGLSMSRRRHGGGRRQSCGSTTAACEAYGGPAGNAGADSHPGVCLSVSDTGSGSAPPAVQARAFEPFFTTKGHGRGFRTRPGNRVRHRHPGGAVGVVSAAPSPGSERPCGVELPTTKDDSRELKELPAQASQRTSLGETILLVEDEDMVREPLVFWRMLRSYATSFWLPPTPRRRFASLTSTAGRISLLLTDVVMPGRSGKDVATELTRLSPETKVLYMSGIQATGVIPAQAISEEEVNLIEKPFIADDLLRRVRQILDRGIEETGGQMPGPPNEPTDQGVDHRRRRHLLSEHGSDPGRRRVRLQAR